MEPLTLLLGYPLSILANVTYDQLKNIKNKIGDLSSIEKLYVDSFFKAIDEHGKHYDEYASKILKRVKNEVKKDKSKFLRIISQEGSISITSFSKKTFQNQVAQRIVAAYDLKLDNYPDLLPSIISDCFSYYVSSFYEQMNEKEGIQAILTECLKLNQILDLLKNINHQIVTKDEFDSLRKIIYTYHVNNNLEYKKTLSDYDSYIKNKFKYLELRGFSPKIAGKEIQMELEDIFVPLAIGKQKEIVPNIGEKPENDENNTIKSIDILDHHALVILGDPGSGKSTLLKYLATQVVGLRESDHLLKNITPVFFRLADYSDYYTKHKKSIYEFIVNHFDNQYRHIYKENFEYSNMLILMDGLDEITETSLRLKVTEQVMDLIARYPNNRYIITSRIVGYQESKIGGNFIHYKLLPFRKEEIILFSDQWYRSIALHTDNDVVRAKQQSESLYGSIFRNPSVFKLATNPLLMTIIAMIHYQGKKLPSKRVELYDVSTETFLEHWVQHRITDEKQLKDKVEIIEILAPIAFEIHKTKSNALIEEIEFREKFLHYFQLFHENTPSSEAKRTCNEFIQFLRQQAGFFYEKGLDDDGNPLYGFMHLTFEEYLAATEFVSKWQEKEIEIADYVFQPRWTEIIRLAASQIRLSFKAKAGRTLTSNFIQDILNVEDDFKDAYRPLQLACLIISDDVSINDSLLNNIFDELIKALSTTKYLSLVKSISKLFSELFLSEKQSYFVEGIKKHIKSDDETLSKNLAVVLVDNFKFPPILELLKENTNEKHIQNELVRTGYENPVRKESFFKNVERNFILKTNNEDLNNEDNYFTLRNCILSTVQLDRWDSIEDKHVREFMDFVTGIEDHTLLDFVVKIFIDRILTSSIINRRTIGENTIDIIKDIANQFSHRYFDNVLKVYEELFTVIFSEDFYHRSSCGLRLNDKYGVLLKAHKRNVYPMFEDYEYELIYIYWNNDFSIIEGKKILNPNVKNDFFKIEYSESDIEKLIHHVHYINGPSNNSDDITNFIDSYKSEHAPFDFFGWEDFPFFNITKNPIPISEILIKNSKRYFRIKGFRRDIDEKNINIELPDKMDIPSPAKLMFRIKTSQPYSDDLVKASIDYYNACSEDMKEGTFEILYSILNLTNTADE